MDRQASQENQASRWNRLEVFRKELAEETTCGDDEMFAELVEDFLDTVEELTEQLELAQQAGDSSLAREAAHSMKSESAMLGGERLQAISLELETQAKEGNLDRWRPLVVPMLEAKKDFCRTLEQKR
jgi:HPt (histidine-containing phosphotransfer) domain-containing protein